VSRNKYYDTLELNEGRVVFLGNNNACNVQGVGTIRLNMFVDLNLFLMDVRYIPNMFDISMLDDISYCTEIENDILKISHGEWVTVKGSKMEFKVREC